MHGLGRGLTEGEEGGGGYLADGIGGISLGDVAELLHVVVWLEILECNARALSRHLVFRFQIQDQRLRYLER